MFPGKNGFTEPQKALYAIRVQQVCNDEYKKQRAKGLDHKTAYENVYYTYKDDIYAAHDGGVSLFSMLPEYQASTKKARDKLLKK